MNKSEWKPILREYLKRNPASSFAHISNLEGAKGNNIYCNADDENIVFWINLDSELVEAMIEMKKDGEIFFNPVYDKLGMLMLGGSLRMPLVKPNLKEGFKKHKTEHWLPVTVNLTEKDK